MIEIVEVTTKKQQKEFLKFPFELYKDCEYFVPPLNIDEKKIFNKDYPYNDDCDVIFYLAYLGEKVVGRISGIIMRTSNEKWKQNRVRFTRFDCINEQEVATKLFAAVEAWAKAKGIDEIVGPLGYSDLEREGLLIEGFDQLGTYEEQYNYAYYQTLIESYGFVKEIDWLEHKLFLPKKKDERLEQISAKMLEKYNLKWAHSKSIKDYIKHYGEQFFEILETTYYNIYGTVPINDRAKKMLIDNFLLLLDSRYIGTIVDENDKMVAFALCFPSLSKTVQKSKGRITLPMLINFLKVKKHPEVLDLGLIGVLPQYESKGVATAIIAALMNFLESEHITHMETNLVLETNFHCLNMLKHFDKIYNKRRRSYVKKID